MEKTNVLSPKFVKSIPEKLEVGVLYVSIEYATTIHKCCCGCGTEVVTPLTPTDWRLIFDGDSVSLYPSIGNWSFPCRSHYWIENNKVIWSWKWTQQEIDEGRTLDAMVKQKYYSQVDFGTEEDNEQDQNQSQPKQDFFQRLMTWLF